MTNRGTWGLVGYALYWQYAQAAIKQQAVATYCLNHRTSPALPSVYQTSFAETTHAQQLLCNHIQRWLRSVLLGS